MSNKYKNSLKSHQNNWLEKYPEGGQISPPKEKPLVQADNTRVDQSTATWLDKYSNEPVALGEDVFTTKGALDAALKPASNLPMNTKIPVWNNKKDVGNSTTDLVSPDIHRSPAKGTTEAMVGLDDPILNLLILGQSSTAKGVANSLRSTIKENFYPRSGLDWMKNWYSNPIIKNKVTNSEANFAGRADYFNDLLKEYQPKNYIDLAKDKGLKQYFKLSPTTSGASYGRPESIYINRTLSTPLSIESTRAHELTHLVERNGRLFSSEEEKQLLEPFIKVKKKQSFLEKLSGYGQNYYIGPTEIHARMNEARYLLNKTPEQPFTIKDFDYIKRRNNWFGMGKYIEDKSAFVKLMNKFYTPTAIGLGIKSFNNKDNSKK